MATYTSNYAWTKPSGGDPVDIEVLNDNLDDQDSIVHQAFLDLAPVFSTANTYAVKDVVLYDNKVWICHTAVTTAGAWTGSTNWTQTTVGETGGVATYADLPDKPSINGNELSGNKTGAQLGLQNTLTFDNVPTANSTNPVKSGGVYSADEAIRQRVKALESELHNTIYGFHIDGDESVPSSMVTYLADAVGKTPAHMDFANNAFNWGSWNDAFFIPKPCMVKSDGSRDYYLDPNDYTKKVDGTASDIADSAYDGNAMMEWRHIWYKIVPDVGSTKSASVYIADYKADDDYVDWCNHNCNGQSVEHFYTPIYNGSVINNVMRSLSGQQVGNKRTADAEVTAAQANNQGTDIIWNTELYCDILLINMLLILIAKTTDTQTAFGQGLHTGGSEAVNNNFRTGIHNAKGLFYGTNSGTIADGNYVNAVKVFGMENWWGFQWRRYQGHLLIDGVQKIKNTYGQEDGSTVEGYNFTGSGFKSVGSTPAGTSGNFISEMNYTDDGMFPKTMSGTSTTHYCDACWFNNSGARVPLRGGNFNDGVKDGAFYANLSVDASNAYWGVGASLSCKPLA